MRGLGGVASLRVRLWLTVMLVCALFVANVWRAIQLELPDHPGGWILVGISPTISEISFGLPHNYTTLSAVKATFDKAYTNDNRLDFAIAEAMALDPAAAGTKTELLGADDKGLVDFVRLSFLIFGFNIAGFVWTYFLLIAVSCIAFIVRFWRQPWALLLVACFLAAHLAVLPTIPINQQLRTLLISRVLSIITLLAFLHLALEVILSWRDGVSWRAVAPGLVQVALLLFVLHITSRVGSQILGMTLLAPLVLVSLIGPVRRRLLGWGILTKSSPRGLWALVALWPVILLWVGQNGLEVYKHRVYSAEYFQGDTASHVFWHILFMGLSAHPELAQEFDIRVSDVDVISATGRYLLAQSRVAEWQAMGGESPGYRDIRWGLHDVAVREMFIATCTRELVRCAVADFWYKPRYLAEYLGWFLRLKHDIPAPHMLHASLVPQFADMQMRMDTEGKVWDLRRIDVAVLIVAVGALLAEPLGRARVTLLGLLGLGLATAAVPSVIAYPIAHTVSDMLVMAGVGMYALLGVASAALVQRIWPVQRAGQPVASR